MDVLTWIERWYAEQTDGEWEHRYGVRIDTLDNPGWIVSIDVAETPLEAAALAPVRWERSAGDWVSCTVENQRFVGAGGPGNLREILEIFWRWAEAPDVQPREQV